jgi:hypothetical protein
MYDGVSMTDKHQAIRNCVFSFQCKAKWENLEEIGEDSMGSEIRFCTSCQREVYFCEDDQSLIRNIRLNRCIAIQRHPFEIVEVGDVYIPGK